MQTTSWKRYSDRSDHRVFQKRKDQSSANRINRYIVRCITYTVEVNWAIKPQFNPLAGYRSKFRGVLGVEFHFDGFGETVFGENRMEPLEYYASRDYVLHRKLCSTKALYLLLICIFRAKIAPTPGESSIVRLL